MNSRMASVWKSPHNSHEDLMEQNKVAGSWRILTANLRNIELVMTDERLTDQFHCILKGLRDYLAVPQARKCYSQFSRYMYSISTDLQPVVFKSCRCFLFASRQVYWQIRWTCRYVPLGIFGKAIRTWNIKTEIFHWPVHFSFSIVSKQF